MGDAKRKAELARISAQAALAEAKVSDDGTRPFQQLCEVCHQDITDRCSVIAGPNGQMLFVVSPAKCPRCGRVRIQVGPKSPIIKPGEAGMVAVPPGVAR